MENETLWMRRSPKEQQKPRSLTLNPLPENLRTNKPNSNSSAMPARATKERRTFWKSCSLKHPTKTPKERKNQRDVVMRRIGLLNRCPYCGKAEELYTSRPQTWHDEVVLLSPSREMPFMHAPSLPSALSAACSCTR